MTAIEKVELCDSLTAVELALNKARLLYDEIKGAYFDKYDPTTISKTDCATGLIYEHPRYSTFLDMLGDYLQEVAAHLPTADWIDALPSAEGVTKA